MGGHMPRRQGLFQRTARTLVLSLFALALVILASSIAFALLPMARRSADDLAALVVLSAQTWAELPPQTRPDFQQELLVAHQMRLEPARQPLEPLDYPPVFFYLRLLHDSLERRLAGSGDVLIGRKADDGERIWIHVPSVEGGLQFGITEERIGARPPLVLLAMLLSVLVVAVGSALLIARRITRPLEALSRAISEVGRGRKTELIQPPGAAAEIATLIHTFNRMAQQVEDLLQNRTTLLAGISHDLRTPLTRLRLLLEIHAGDLEPDSRRRIEASLEDMEQLLRQTLQLARGIDRQEPLQERDLVALLQELVQEQAADWQRLHPGEDQELQLELGEGVGEALRWPIPEQSCRRVLRNLLGNAVRYASGAPIRLRLDREGDCPVIRVLDRGPGIPEDQREVVFRPFHRLEASRNAQTGGSGLGLAIVRQLCEAFGWQVELLGREGGGTEARLRLCPADDGLPSKTG